MTQEENITYLNNLANFGKRNPKDGPLFIDYLASIIVKFDITQRINIIYNLINSYYSYFNQNFIKLKEATDLFIPFLAQIKGEKQANAITQYYGLYINKNYERNNTIAQIENEYQQSVDQIENQYNLDQIKAQQDYNDKKRLKTNIVTNH